MPLNDFEKSLNTDSDKVIKEAFTFGAPDGNLYHYTRESSAISIVNSQEFRASFIRATSDPLEFTSNLVQCRNWLCSDSTSLAFSEFPFQLFSFFNQQATSPSIRPYFCSFTENEDSYFLKNMYGDTRIHLKKGASPLFARTPFLIKCKYEIAPKDFIYSTLDIWAQECLERNLKLYGLTILNTKKIWLPKLMQISFVLSLALKDPYFSREEEWRYIAMPDDPNVESTWHKKRFQQFSIVQDHESLTEYLPLKMNQLGFFPELA